MQVHAVQCNGSMKQIDCMVTCPNPAIMLLAPRAAESQSKLFRVRAGASGGPAKEPIEHVAGATGGGGVELMQVVDGVMEQTGQVEDQADRVWPSVLAYESELRPATGPRFSAAGTTEPDRAQRGVLPGPGVEAFSLGKAVPRLALGSGRQKTLAVESKPASLLIDRVAQAVIGGHRRVAGSKRQAWHWLRPPGDLPTHGVLESDSWSTFTSE